MRTVKSQKGLFYGIPTLGRPTPIQWGLSLTAMRPPINFQSTTGVIWGQQVADARNGLAKTAIEQDAKYLFFHGDDVTGPGHSLQTLIYRMEHDEKLGVVGGVYCSKSTPAFPLVCRGNGAGSFGKWRAGEYFWVDGIGMDMTVIRVEMLKEIEEPWCKTIGDSGYLDGESSEERWTEDLYFCKKVMEETDYTIFCDSMVMCEHWQYRGGYEWQTFTLRADSYPMQRKEIKGKQILDLGCGPQHWDFGDEGQVTRVDLRDECEPDFRSDLRLLPFGPKSYDVVFSSHVLEHFGREEMMDVLEEWLKVLKPDGEFRIIVPNLEWAAKEILKKRISADALNVLYGSQEYALNFHKNGFTPARLKGALKKAGLEVVKEEEFGYNILMHAVFAHAAKKTTKRKKKVKKKARKKRK